jgi:hypothetical protein
MKLRISGTSVRIRVSKSETEKFSEKGILCDRIFFGPLAENALGVTLARGPFESVRAEFERQELTILVPADTASFWLTTDQTGFESTQYVGDRGDLKIIVEKDLKPDDSNRS